MAALVIRFGKHQGKKLTLPDGEVFIGRGEECQIRFPSPDLSRKHCKLVCRNDEISVSDLDSGNGTRINDEKVAENTPLNPGDLLQVGPLVFQMPERTPAKEAEPRTALATDDLESLSNASSIGDTTIVSGPQAAQLREDAAANAAQSGADPVPAEGGPVEVSDDPFVAKASEIIQSYRREQARN
ncbi:FHA domain-containing protein [Stratiformator vulcanicus]|uniref:FHA domain-containing protein FhaA n=1 Tax=Stratiformator vulcanicus TaxID=2527980 RepID=A0A517R6E4_9PLAN|nr:FHA domain-containing protein [Stratiformator vulcanicus]QDT39441.1 FHA domain-containing protein FhaA [Stratiformator vulcanicus]